MWKILKQRMKQGLRTIKFPKEDPVLPARYRGKPLVREGQTVDLGKALFEPGALEYAQDFRMAVSKREDFLLKGDELKLAQALQGKMKSLFGRSLRLREVCAGGCNGCDAEINVLNTVVFDLSRFGIDVVASPRHADGLIITGPVTKNMELALKKTYDALSEPRLVIAVGACAIAGGPFEGSPQVRNGADKIIPVDLYIPGCPPHPLTILDGLLRLLDKETFF